MARDAYKPAMKHVWVILGSIVVATAAVACSSLKETDVGGSSGGPGDEAGGSSGSSGEGGSSGGEGGSSSGEAGTDGGPLANGNKDPRYFQGPIPADSPPLATFTITNGSDGALVYDKTMDITWQDNVPMTSTSLELSLAQDYCTNLTYDGLTGWRLPTRFEQLSAMDLAMTYGDSKVTTSAFSAVSGASCFWSASVAAIGTPPDHLAMNTAGISSTTGGSGTKCAARCVRGLPIPSKPTPVAYDLSDGTVIKDLVTGLYWERTPPDPTPSLTNNEQKARCEKLTYGGKPGRLPNVKELASITDETRYNPALIGAFGIYSGAFITANPVWSVGMSDGRISQGTTSGFDYLARCVAGP